MPDVPKTYVLVRRDLPVAIQMVQVAHACLEAGSRFPQPEYSHLVVCAVANEDALRAAQEAVWDVRTYIFFEPDLPAGAGYTALCTEPLPAEAWRLFRRYPLWEAPCPIR